MKSLDSFKCRSEIQVDGKTYRYFDLKRAEENGLAGLSRMPNSLKILIENLLRWEDDRTVSKKTILATMGWLTSRGKEPLEIAYRPARVLMHDFTGVPALVDLAAMREAAARRGEDPAAVNPNIPVDLVIDHSVSVDAFGGSAAFARNVELEYKRNMERYRFLKWGQKSLSNLRVVPPGTGICHQVNLEYLSQSVWLAGEGDGQYVFPDTCVGTDSHTPMVNGLGILAWGVGGIEAEAAMLGQPISMLLPEVIGFQLSGALREGVTATDLVLTVTEMLRKKGVVGKFVEFFGPGVASMPLADRATVANMAPEYGATCGFFATDAETLRYLKVSGRDEDRIALAKAYAQAQGLFADGSSTAPLFTDTITLDLGSVEPSMAGPKRPEGRVPLARVGASFASALANDYKRSDRPDERYAVTGHSYTLGHGDVVLAAITSCTNTSNPALLVAAGLLARNAVERGLSTKAWTKTSLTPGSQVVAGYLQESGLQQYLDKLGFNVVGFGCTTCIGNSGPLPDHISGTIRQHDLVAAAVISGNRNFEGRVSPDVQANYLASPPLVVAHALAGTVRINLETDPLGTDRDGRPVYLRDIWPSGQEVAAFVEQNVTRKLFLERYANIFEGDARWQAVDAPTGEIFSFDDTSTYIRKPPYFDDGLAHDSSADIVGARILGIFGDKITTDHISPAGSIAVNSPAAAYLKATGIQSEDFNLYGTRRGNHEVMMRGTFGNIRIRNLMLGENGKAGGYTIEFPSRKEATIYDAAIRYGQQNVPLVVFAGREYGNGSSRDWAAKGPHLLGVKAVIAESFERIHRSNLIGMGILPLALRDDTTLAGLGLTGAETVTVRGLSTLTPGQDLIVSIADEAGPVRDVTVRCRIDTIDELAYFRAGGILPYVLDLLAQDDQAA